MRYPRRLRAGTSIESTVSATIGQDPRAELPGDLDPTLHFPLHEHLCIAYALDGSITLGVPWSSYSVATAEHDLVAAQGVFNSGYMQLLQTSQAELDALVDAMLARGYVPLSKR